MVTTSSGATTCGAEAVGVLTQDTEATLHIYQQANAADPEAIGVYTNLAGSLTSLGRNEEARRSRANGLFA